MLAELEHIGRVVPPGGQASARQVVSIWDGPQYSVGVPYLVAGTTTPHTDEHLPQFQQENTGHESARKWAFACHILSARDHQQKRGYPGRVA